jgi:hypothetical protein
MGLRPPFMLSEYGSEQGVFPSLKALTDHVEAIYLRDGIYRVFDSTGRIVAPRAETDRRDVTAVPTDDRDSEALMAWKPRTGAVVADPSAQHGLLF